VDPVTYLSGFLCSDGYVLNGEGSLIYPGSRVQRYTGQKDVDGPVSSIRFEMLRRHRGLRIPVAAEVAGRSKIRRLRPPPRWRSTSRILEKRRRSVSIREKMAKRIEQLDYKVTGTLRGRDRAVGPRRAARSPRSPGQTFTFAEVRAGVADVRLAAKMKSWRAISTSSRG